MKFIRKNVLGLKSAKELAEALSARGFKVSRGGVANWEQGKNIGIEAMRSLALLAHVDLNWISHEEGEAPIGRDGERFLSNIKPPEKAAKALLDRVNRTHMLSLPKTPIVRSDLDVPLLSMVAAGNLRHQPGITPADVVRHIKIGELPPGDWVALQADGDSMNRVAPDGALLLVDRSDDRLIDGRFYIFSVGGGEATFKMFKRADKSYPNRMVPYSTNLDHMPISADQDDLYVFGRVKRIILDV